MKHRQHYSYGKQWIDKGDIKKIVRVLESDWLTQGPNVLEFEKALARYCGAAYAVAVNSGTSALHVAYAAARLEKGDEVITSPNTFVATINMLLAVGAKPIFCDIRNDTYNIDESKIEALITKKTKAIIPVHFAGQPCEMDTILKIAKKYALRVIEDACHALGARYKDRPIGGLSDMTVFSFHPVKAITTGEGGAIVTNNKEYHELSLKLRSHGIIKDKNGFNSMVDLGYNYRLTDIQAALGISQLKKLDTFIEKRRRIAQWYKEELSILKDIILPKELPRLYSAWHIYVIRTKNQKTRSNLMRYLKKNNIETAIHYPAVYSHPYYQRIGYDNIKLENEGAYQHSCITLPLHPQLTRGDILYISTTIKQFFT